MLRRRSCALLKSLFTLLHARGCSTCAVECTHVTSRCIMVMLRTSSLPCQGPQQPQLAQLIIPPLHAREIARPVLVAAEPSAVRQPEQTPLQTSTRSIDGRFGKALTVFIRLSAFPDDPKEINGDDNGCTWGTCCNAGLPNCNPRASSRVSSKS